MRCKNIARLHFRHKRQRLCVAEMAFAMPMLFQVCFKRMDTEIVGRRAPRAPPDRRRRRADRRTPSSAKPMARRDVARRWSRHREIEAGRADGPANRGWSQRPDPGRCPPAASPADGQGLGVCMPDQDACQVGAGCYAQCTPRVGKPCNLSRRAWVDHSHRGRPLS